jgi:hypothetical protein
MIPLQHNTGEIFLDFSNQNEIRKCNYFSDNHFDYAWTPKPGDKERFSLLNKLFSSFQMSKAKCEHFSQKFTNIKHSQQNLGCASVTWGE